MADHSPTSAAAGSGRPSLPAGAGARVRRGYLLMALVTVALLMVTGAVSALAAFSLARGQRGVLPALLAGSAGSGSLLLLTLAAVMARSAVAGDLVDIAAMRRAARSAVLGQAFAAAGAVAALGSGLLIANGGGGSLPLWVAVGTGVPVACLWGVGSTVRRLAATTADAAGS